MPYFQGLSDDFVRHLNDLYASPSGAWWRAMLADPELFVAIRNNYLNVYFRGCSLARVRLDGGNVIAETHYKYLLKPSLPKPYILAVAGELQVEDRWSTGVTEPFITSLSDTQALKAAAKPYAGDEKKFVGEVIGNNPNIVDVEIALTKKAEEATDAEPAKGASAKRIDIVALRWEHSRPVLDFYEAKLFGNKEIRAEGNAKVIGQIKRYEDLLAQYEGDIARGYRRSCENVLALDGIPDVRKNVVNATLPHLDDLAINKRPYLVIGGFDEDQRLGAVWKRHREKLTRALGEDRVILRGSGKGLKIASGKAPSA